MSRVIVFDVNETLLDLEALDHHFERIFGTAAARREWFQQVIQSAMTVTLTGRYHDFSTVAGAALEMVAERRSTPLGEDDRREIAEAMRRLPPHPEVPAALQRLRGAGLRLVALTNSPPAVMERQLKHAGIDGLLERKLSVESARQLKPALGVYRTAAARLEVETREMLMVAAHGWDLAGAMSAGCGAAFVARPGQVLEALLPRPEIVGPDMAAVAEAILSRET